MSWDNITEKQNQNSMDVDDKSIIEILSMINSEDSKVSMAVKSSLDDIKDFIDALVIQFKKGGRLFYVGSGTSGRLGVLDAAECPPTFRTDPEMVQCEDEAMFSRIREWAQDRGLYDEGNAHTQYVKLQEEAGELAKALLNKDKAEIIDAIGDMVVVLTNLAHIEGVHIETCIKTAYSVISKRKGKMINGTFVKDEN